MLDLYREICMYGCIEVVNEKTQIEKIKQNKWVKYYTRDDQIFFGFT